MAALKASADLGARLLAAGGAAGLLIAAFDYLTPASGIDQSGGAELVIVSCALVLAAALAVARWRPQHSALRAVLVVLLFLGVIGTALAAWFLEADWLLAAMAVGMVGWLMLVFGERSNAGDAS